MNYHIGTMLIGENFDGGKECPVCRIKRAVDLRLTEQYLGEGVMEDHTRAEVNALGFFFFVILDALQTRACVTGIDKAEHRNERSDARQKFKAG